MASRPSCSLCGAPFRGQTPTVVDANEPGQWYSLARGIRGHKSSSDVAHPELTGPGYIVGGRLVAIFDPDTTALVANQFSHRHELSLNDETQPIIYGVHEFCWGFLLWRIGVGKEASRSVAAWLFHVLAALPYSRAGGLIAQDGYTGTSIDTAEILQADPALDTFLDAINDTPLPESIATPQSLFKSNGQVARADPFGRLPLEIMHGIFDVLASEDLCNARLASRFFAECASPAALPQGFWAGRFAWDREMGFIDIDTAASNTDYYQLYRKSQMIFRSEARPDGLLNRKRIWRCVATSAATIQALLSTPRSDWDSPSPRPNLPEDRRVGDGVSCPELSPALAGPGSLVFGAKTHRTQVLSFERTSTSTDPLLLQFSTILFDGRPYLSGLRVSADGESHHAGYMVPSTTEFVCIESRHKIRVIDVYISIAGIHGMILYGYAADGSRGRYYVGLTSPPDDLDVAVTRLRTQGMAGALFLGLDMFKLVSLHVIDTMATSQRVPAPPVLWKSRIPPNESHRPLHAELSKDPLSLSFFLMHLRIPFGGEDGSRLSSLSRITGLLDGAIGLHGLIFTYEDQKEVLYGARVSPRCAGPSRICVEQSFLIDGPGGERIVEITYSSRTGSDALRIGYPGISAMEVVTNFKRRHTFCAFDNYGNIRVQMHRRTVRASPAGHCPTVLTVGLGAPAWFLETAETSGFIPLPETDLTEIQADTPQSAPSDQVLACSPWMLSVGGSCFTAAPLADVQRVRVSAGARGRCRNRSYISGLWLEYRGQTRDAIVGQWMTEIDQFTLEPDETIVEISVRATKETELRGTGGGVGKVACLTFMTSLGKKYEFRQREVSAESHLRYEATPYEDLATITWAFNSSIDDIQLSLTPSPALGRGNFLLLCDANLRLRHPWLLQEDTRIFYKYGDPLPRNPAVRDVGSLRRDAAARRYTSVCDMFFWEERDPGGSGEILRLMKIEVMHREGVVDGFRFEYEGGLVRGFGSQDIDKSVLDLTKHVDERPSSLVIYYITDSRSGLEIHTTRGQVCRVFPENEASNQAYSYALVPGARAPNLTITESHRASGHHGFPDQNPSGDSVCECVGMWVAGYPTNGSPIPYVDSFGPIYRTGSQAQPEEEGRSGLRQTLRGLLKRDN